MNVVIHLRSEQNVVIHDLEKIITKSGGDDEVTTNFKEFAYYSSSTPIIFVGKDESTCILGQDIDFVRFTKY